ncbi:unnamed protein product [Vitrella brassicaformis CCMP3155]|uniref:Uncharacterized protein n=1 Tax=Vitrella brassicaformis (strain CCMP3155) TaxID=1169540 RepID=A0A0G4FYC8_VITBC|nr:unnamed protein product [Vitrella brassicaformis CCMP3155]|eukprot:CEM20452.1 unnamed protein product [Vitrella brassicaformis CCMP3155]
MAQSSSAASQAPPVPPGCKGLDDVDIVPDEGVSPLSRQLLEGCIRRAFTDAAQVTQLIEQGADPRAAGGLRVHGGIPGRAPYSQYSCLPFAIDSLTNYPLLYASGADGSSRPVVLPQWASRQLQRDILSALIDGGADVNGGGWMQRPITMGIVAGNLTAVEALLARQANVRGFGVMELPYVPHAALSPTREYEDTLMSIYRRLIQHDSTLAEERVVGDNLVHLAARATCMFSQQLIDQYLTLITSHGADMTAADRQGRTPLHEAARAGSHFLAEWLCHRLTADDVNRGLPNQPNMTPLAFAAEALYNHIRIQQQSQRRWRLRLIHEHKTIIGVLLRAGAAPSIARMPTATEDQRRLRQLVLAEYAAVLSELSEAVMSAINGALAPQRDHLMLLARLLPLAPHHDGAHPHPSPSNMAFGPHEAEAIGWKIGAFLHEPPAAVAAIDEYLIGESVLRRRVKAAVGHFVKSAATQTSSNREVVGGTRYEQQGDKRVKVTAPPLQCFRVGGVGGRKMGVRKVVHRARLDEAGTHGVPLEGVVKGFNEHLGDQDCQFEWGQLGRIDRTTGLFVSLGID